MGCIRHPFKIRDHTMCECYWTRLSLIKWNIRLTNLVNHHQNLIFTDIWIITGIRLFVVSTCVSILLIEILWDGVGTFRLYNLLIGSDTNTDYSTKGGYYI